MKLKVSYGATIPTKQYENFRPDISFELDSEKDLDKARKIAFGEIAKSCKHIGISNTIYLK